MNVRRAAAQRQAAKAWWATLGNAERWQIGDALVLGEFDWREWGFEKPPSAAFLREVDKQRIQWEILRGSSEVLPLSTRRAQKLRAMRAKMLAKLQHQGELRGPWPFHLKRIAQMLVDQGRARWATPGVLALTAPALPG